MTGSLAFVLAKGLRIGASLQWLFLLLGILRGKQKNHKVHILLLFSLAVVGYLLVPFPFLYRAPLLVGMFFLFCAYLTVPLIWVAACSLFQDEFRFRSGHLAIIISAEIFCFATVPGLPTSAWLYAILRDSRLLSEGVYLLFPQLLTAFFAILAILEARRGAESDLMETRLRFRHTFVYGAGPLLSLIHI